MTNQERFSAGTGLPFSTTNAILANCLLVAGMQPTPWSPRHLYSADILFTAGGGVKDDSGNVVRKSRFSGMPLLEAAQSAWKQNVRGKVEYHFEHSPELQYFVDAYTDQVKQIEEGEGDAGEAVRTIIRKTAGRLEAGEKVMDEREALVRIFCTALKMRIPFVNAWKDMVPVLSVPHEGEISERTEGNRKIVSHPGGRFVPLNASDEMLRKMKLL